MIMITNQEKLPIGGALFNQLKPTLFEFYKQGFLFSNFVLNGGLAPSKSELKMLIIEDFKDFFEQNLEEHLLKLNDQTNSDKPKELNLSDIIKTSEDSAQALKPEMDKVLTTCPLCSKQILASDINLEKIDLSKINNFPFDYIHIHSNGEHPPHALLMYFDAHFKVRGRKVPKFTNLK